MFKKTILFDLDGVLNMYNGNYDENFIPPIKDGAYEFVKELSKDYKVVIFTTRDSILASDWIKDNNLAFYSYCSLSPFLKNLLILLVIFASSLAFSSCACMIFSIVAF